MFENALERFVVVQKLDLYSAGTYIQQFPVQVHA
jgi:hypothetical protein